MRDAVVCVDGFAPSLSRRKERRVLHPFAQCNINVHLRYFPVHWRAVRAQRKRALSVDSFAQLVDYLHNDKSANDPVYRGVRALAQQAPWSELSRNAVVRACVCAP